MIPRLRSDSQGAKVLERFRFKTIDSGEYTLVTTGILPASEYGPTERVGFITGQGLDAVRCSWTDTVAEGRELKLHLVCHDTGERRVLRTSAIVRLKVRRCWFGYQRHAYTGKRVC